MKTIKKIFLILYCFFCISLHTQAQEKAIVLSSMSVSIHKFWKANGFAHTTGIVSNNSSEFASITLKIEYLDKNGKALEVMGISQSIKTEFGYAQGNFDIAVLAHGVVSPQETVPFDVIRNLKNIKGEVENVKISVMKANWKAIRCNYSLSNPILMDITNGKQFAISISNSCNEKELRPYPQITVAFYDEKDQVIGVQSFENKLPSEGLAQGKTIKIEGKVYNPAGTIFKIKTLKFFTSHRL